MLQDWSTPTSTTAQFTSNASNYVVAAFKTASSTVAIFTSNTSNYYANTLHYDPSTPITSTTVGLGTAGYISSSQLTSTLTGLGTAGYLSSSQLISTVNGLGNAGYVSTTQLFSTTLGLQQYVSTKVGTTVGNATGEVLYLNYSVTVETGLHEINPTPTSATVTDVSTPLAKNASLSLIHI